MSVSQTVEKLFTDRRSWESLWDTTYRYVAPERAAIFATSSKEDASSIQEEVFDSTAIEAAEKLVNLLISGMIPPWSKWFRLVPNEVLDEQAREQMREPLQDVAALVLQTLSASNFYQEAQPMLLDRVVGGTGGLSMKINNGQLTFRCIPLHELAVAEDSLGRVSQIARRFQMDLLSLKRLYWDKIPEHRKQELERKKDSDRVDVMEMSRLEVDEQWQYVLVLKGSPEIELERDVTPVSRLVVTRWSKVPGHPYGRGPGLRALSDVRALNKLKELTLQNAALAVSGVYTVVADGVINPATLDIVPGARIPVATNSPNDPSILPLPSFAAFDVANFSMEDLRNSIKGAFMADQFQSLGRTPLSATEVAERTRVIASDMGASLSRMQTEFLVPVLKFVLHFLRQQGQAPDFVDIQGQFTDVQFVSRLAQAQWTEDFNNLVEILGIAGQMAEVDPRAGLVIDGEAAIREMGELRGLPQKLMRTTDQVTENMQAAQQAQQEQNVVEEGLTG